MLVVEMLQEQCVPISVGAGRHADHQMRAANTALYAAKAQGRDRIVLKPFEAVIG